MQIDILTIFPYMFTGPFADSIIKRAISNKKVKIKIHDLRDWSTDNHRSVDARPYGGGAGMIMRVDIIDKAVEYLKKKTKSKKIKTILLDTKAPLYTQQKAQKLAKIDHLILIAGHYEGLDHRVHEHVVDEVISIGEYVLTGGEIPAMVVVDSIVRLLPGVINPNSLKEESYQKKSKVKGQRSKIDIEYPQYTRPKDYKGWQVPEILLSGNHKQIDDWRQKSKP